jgi:hypothetical protein
MKPAEIVEFLFEKREGETSERTNLKLILASTLCASSQELSKIILRKEELLKEFVDNESTNLSQWKSTTRFWYNCAQEATVKQMLSDKEVPQILYKQFKKLFGPEIEDSTAGKFI